MLAQGVPLKVVQEILGHRQLSLTALKEHTSWTQMRVMSRSVVFYRRFRTARRE